MNFIVIDKKIGVEANAEEIVLTEEWAKGLVHCDLEGFAITEDGSLILLDECGNFVYCDPERFEVVYKYRCKFRSTRNCDFCAFCSDCDERMEI